MITKPDKGNEVVFSDQKHYDNTIQEIISDTSKLEKLKEDKTLKRDASPQHFLLKLQQKTFLTKMNMTNCILLVLLLFVSIVLLKSTNFPLVINLLNFIRLFHL